MKPALLILLFISSLTLIAQETIIGMAAGYSYQFPAMDMSQKYTAFQNVSLNFNIKSTSNWIFGLEGQFLFGSDYKDKRILGSMVTNGGFVIGENENIQNLSLEGRGGAVFFNAGKIFTLSKNNLNSGLCAKLGLGYSFYKVFTYVDDQVVYQLSPEYRHGYNRLEGGLSLQPFLGYVYYGPGKMFNASIGVEGIMSFTSYLTKWDYGSNTDLSGYRFTNLLIGPKATFTIRFKTIANKKQKAADEFYYN